MLLIKRITSQFLELANDQDPLWVGHFGNTQSGRRILLSELSRMNSTELWTEIEKVWGTAPLSKGMFDDPAAVRELVRARIKDACKSAIISGVDVDCGLLDEEGNPRGVLHYDLTERHQTDMRDLANLLNSSLTCVTWRDSSRVSHEIYTKEQFFTLYDECSRHILRCRFHSDGLELLLDSIDDEHVAEMLNITWATPLTDAIIDQLQILWSVMYPGETYVPIA